MLKNILFIIFICLTSLSLFSQNLISEIDNTIFTTKSTDKKSYTLSNTLNSELVIALENQKKRKTQLLLLDSTYKKMGELFFTPTKKFPILLGYSINQKTYRLYFSNTKKNKIRTIIADFDDQSLSSKISDFKISGEKFVDNIQYNNQLYLLTVSKNNERLNFYLFNKSSIPKKVTVSLNTLKNSIPNFNASLLLTGKQYIKVDPSIPNALEVTSKKTKLYVFPNKIIISFDIILGQTNICSIDLKTLKLSPTIFNSFIKDKSLYTKSNSYLFHQKLFQISSSNKIMKFAITDYKTQKLIKEFIAHKGSPISFKNTPIIQDGGGFIPELTDSRELEKTAKYLRKISHANLGISIFKSNDLYKITLGGYKEMPNNNAFATFPSGAAPGFASFNPIFFAYTNYKNTKSTYITGLFDINFQHKEGKIFNTDFEHIKKFERRISTFTAKNIFSHDGILHYGLFHTKSFLYKIYQFKK
ncbi:hypothetical protein [Aquimarina rhabdastrellae]